jgi:hypothetical protein
MLALYVPGVVTVSVFPVAIGVEPFSQVMVPFPTAVKVIDGWLQVSTVVFGADEILSVGAG